MQYVCIFGVYQRIAVRVAYHDFEAQGSAPPHNSLDDLLAHEGAQVHLCPDTRCVPHDVRKSAADEHEGVQLA